ncbi:hypothetical protein TNCV_4333901 [Trichonephila clavipes]|nr:hypothetical protein TNCV_4333901 [Trichonephila clavipes]
MISNDAFIIKQLKIQLRNKSFSIKVCSRSYNLSKRLHLHVVRPNLEGLGCCFSNQSRVIAGRVDQCLLSPLVGVWENPIFEACAAVITFPPYNHRECVTHHIVRFHNNGGHGNRVVMVLDCGWPCPDFEPSTTNVSPCREAMHVKSIKSSKVLPLVWCGS